MTWHTLGFNKNKKYFDDIIEKKQLGHAFVFWGENMIGKRTFALELCDRINQNGNGGIFDMRIVAPKIHEGETKIYIEDARELKSFLSLKPLFGRYKIVIIDDAECLTTEASNAILKILEEPPSSGFLILITSRPKALPKTIYSRCHHVHFANHTEKIIEDYLSNQKINSSDAEFLIKMGHGRIGWIAKIIVGNQINGIKKDIDEFNKIIGAGVFEKMSYAKKLTEREDRADVLNNLIYYLSVDINSKLENVSVLASLLKTFTVISQPQYNHRLVLENFLLSL